jgi:hypothetical protein
MSSRFLAWVSVASAIVALMSATSGLAQPTSPGVAASVPVAVLQALDKVTGRVRVIEAPLGAPVRFEALEITARACRKRPPEETPETAAFLEIDDARPGQPTRRVFTGWMFASSPAVSALEHPVYDVWVIDCRMARPAGSRSP